MPNAVTPVAPVRQVVAQDPADEAAAESRCLAAPHAVAPKAKRGRASA